MSHRATAYVPCIIVEYLQPVLPLAPGLCDLARSHLDCYGLHGCILHWNTPLVCKDGRMFKMPDSNRSDWLYTARMICTRRNGRQSTVSVLVDDIDKAARLTAETGDSLDGASGTYIRISFCWQRTLGARFDINVKVEYPKPKRIVFLPSAILVQF